MGEYPKIVGNNLTLELNVRFPKVYDPYHAFIKLHSRQVKRKAIEVFAERLYALVNEPFTKVHNMLIESQLVGFFIDGLYHDFLFMKVIRENPKTFQVTVQSALAEQNL